MAQDNYVGDIGDFANNGLLRYLCGLNDAPKPDQPLTLGIVWYRNKGDSSSPDGNHINYLNVSDFNNSLYRECDKKLYDALQKLVGESLVKQKKRDIDQLIKSSILPDGTRHHSEDMGAKDRGEWVGDALKKTNAADLVFINPDTGLKLNILPADRKEERKVELKLETKSVKHASLSELRAFVVFKQSLVIYQHDVRASVWIKDFARELKKLSRNSQLRVWALQWHRVQGRTYFVVAQPHHKQILDTRIKALLGSPWGKKKPSNGSEPHFTLY